MFDRESQEAAMRAEIARAEKAQLVLDNPEYIKAIEELETHLISRLKTEGDRKNQARLTDQLQAVHSVANCLKRTIETGHLAIRELKEKGWF